MRRLSVSVIIAGAVGLVASLAGAHSPAPAEWRASVEKAPAAECIEVVANTEETFKSSSPYYGYNAELFEVRNRCERTVQFEVASCQRTNCEDASCSPISCSGGPYRIRPAPAGDVGDVQSTQGVLSDADGGLDTATGDTRVGPVDADGGDIGSVDAETGDAADGSDVDEDATTEPGDADVGPSDAGADTVADSGDLRELGPDVYGSLGSQVYGLEQVGLQGADFGGDEATVTLVFNWRLETVRSGTFEIEVDYEPPSGSPPRTGPCGCAAATRGDRLPVGPWALFLVGLFAVRRWRRR